MSDDAPVRSKAVSQTTEAPWVGLTYVAVAVFFFSTTPVLIRFSAPFTAFEIGFIRLFVATAAVGVMALASGLSLRFAREDYRKFAVYGLITALHFVLYIASLSFTSVTHSLALVYTAPVFVSLFSALFLRESLPRVKYVGIAIAIVGVAILAGFEPTMTPTMLFGDVLAIGSAICFGLYSVAGRFERTSYPLLRYAFGVYGCAAAWLLPFALIWQHQGPPFWEMDARPLLSVVALGIFPLAIGHTLYNASLRRVHATYVNLVATQEVTGGVLLGMIFLGEVPSLVSVVGAAVTLLGVALVLRN